MIRRAVALLYGCGLAALGVKGLRDTAEFGIGSGTRTRALNLAVNRSAPPVKKWRSEFAKCR